MLKRNYTTKPCALFDGETEAWFALCRFGGEAGDNFTMAGRNHSSGGNIYVPVP